MKNLFYAFLILLTTVSIAYSNRVLVDDAPMCGWHERFVYQPLWNTLGVHGASVEFTSTLGRFPELTDYDMVILMHHGGDCTEPIVGYNFEQRTQLIDYVCRGGNILIMPMGINLEKNYYTELLSDSRWVTGLTLSLGSWSIAHTTQIASYPPITDGLEYLKLMQSTRIHAEAPAYPFVWDMSLYIIQAAVSYPYRSDGEDCDCHYGGRIIVICDNHTFEFYVVHYIEPMNYRFINNITLSMAKVLEDSLEDCKKPGDIPPLPPDPIIDSVSCADPGDNAYIYGEDLEPSLSLYFDDAIQAFEWHDSTKISFTIPIDAEQGMHKIRIEASDKILYAFIKVYCDWLIINRFVGFCGDIGDTIQIRGENISNLADMTFGGTLFYNYYFDSDTSGWFVVPDTAGLANFSNYLGNSKMYLVCIINESTQKFCRPFLVPCPCPPDSKIVISFNNVYFWERTDGTDSVYIIYEMDADSAQNIVLSCSSDKGSTWVVPCTTVYGDVGMNIEPKDSNIIIWGAKNDIPSIEHSNWMFRVQSADSGGIQRNELPQDTINPPAVTTFTDDTTWALARISSFLHWHGFGYSVASAGDFNGSGLSDVIIGASSYYNDGAYIFYGGVDLKGRLSHTDVDVYIEGFGSRNIISVHSAGDVNNDGYDDVIIGATGSTSKAYVILGGSSISDTLDAPTDGVVINVIDSASGCNVGGDGNVNNDDYDDVIIGAPGINKAFICLGNSGFSGPILTADITLSGISGSFGNCVADNGDINDDGFDDILVSEVGNNKAYIFLGGPLLPPTLTTLDADIVFDGDPLCTAFGTFVSFLGDINSDGFDDIGITDSRGALDAGVAHIFMGQSTLPDTLKVTDADITITGSGTRRFGNCISYAYDVNDDGFDDVIISEYYNSRGYLLFGGSSLASTYLSTELPVLIHGEVFWRLGFRESRGAGDINGDGSSEIIIGAVNDSMRGNVYIFSFGLECPFGSIYDIIESDPGPIDTKLPEIDATCPPNGEIGQIVPIRWTVSDSFIIPLTFGPPNPIRIYFSKDGIDFSIVIATPNDGEYEWMYPNVNTEFGYLMVCATDSFGHTSCDTCGPFSVEGDTTKPFAYIYSDTCWPDTVFYVIKNSNEEELIDCERLLVTAPDGYYNWGDSALIQIDDTLFAFDMSFVDTTGLDREISYELSVLGICDEYGNCYCGEIEVHFWFCEERCSLNVTLSGDTSICIGDTCELTATIEGYELSDLTLMWNPTDYIVGSNENIVYIVPETSITFTLIVTYNPNCIDTTSIFVEVIDCCSLDVDITGDNRICWGENTWLNIQSNGYELSELTSIWEPEFGIISIHEFGVVVQPDTSTVYQAIVSYDTTCVDTSSFLVNVVYCNCHRPNPFTPNWDGFNDLCEFTYPGMMEDRANIYIYNLHNIEVKKLTVSVGSKAKYDAQWDGTDKHGNLLPEGLYIYLIIVDDNIVCEGTVTIAR